MNTDSLLWCREPLWYSRGACLFPYPPSVYPPLHANANTCGPHMAQILWFTASDLERMGWGNCAAVGFKPQFPRLNWQSLGAWAGKVDESIGSNEILFTQLVGEMLGESWGSPLSSPSWTPRPTAKTTYLPPPSCPAAPLHTGLWISEGNNVNRNAGGVHLGLTVVGKKQRGKRNNKCTEQLAF